MTTFKPGDKVRVSFFGEQVFTLLKLDDEDFPIYFEVTKPNGSRTREVFKVDGRLTSYHTHPVLTMVEPKKEPIRVECEMDYTGPQFTLRQTIASAGPITLPMPTHWTQVLIGKKGKLIFIEESV